MASPINNIPENIIEETLIQLEGDTDIATNSTPSALQTIETAGFRGCKTANTNVYLKRIDADAKSSHHTALNPLHSRAVRQRTRANTQKLELFISENPQYSINIHRALAEI